ncbi:MAG: hypothetical protein ACE3JK_08920 [Sporolactobacillus sp.]
MAYETDYFFLFDSITKMLMISKITEQKTLVIWKASINAWYTAISFTPFREGVTASTHMLHLLLMVNYSMIL